MRTERNRVDFFDEHRRRRFGVLGNVAARFARRRNANGGATKRRRSGRGQFREVGLRRSASRLRRRAARSCSRSATALNAATAKRRRCCQLTAPNCAFSSAIATRSRATSFSESRSKRSRSKTTTHAECARYTVSVLASGAKRLVFVDQQRGTLTEFELANAADSRTERRAELVARRRVALRSGMKRRNVEQCDSRGAVTYDDAALILDGALRRRGRVLKAADCARLARCAVTARRLVFVEEVVEEDEYGHAASKSARRCRSERNAAQFGELGDARNLLRARNAPLSAQLTFSDKLVRARTPKRTLLRAPN